MPLTASDIGTGIDLVGAFVLLVLALLVLRVRPRRRVAMAFAASIGLYGLEFTLNNGLVLANATTDASWTFLALLDLLSNLALVPLVLWFPRPLRDDERRVIFPGAAAAAAAFAVLGAIPFLADWEGATVALPGTATWSFAAQAVLGVASGAVAGFAIVVLPLRFHLSSDPSERRALGTFAIAGVLLASGLGIGMGSTFPAQRNAHSLFIAVTVATTIPQVAIVAFLWFRNASGAHARLARDVALVLLGSILAGMVYFALIPGSQGNGANGVARLGEAGILFYAIFRGQMLGLDLKVKFAISRSTLAAVFIAVFLVAEQLVQNVFSTSLGVVAGAVVAGLLLFALTPLQRFAERVADKAMPNVKSVGEMSHPERMRTYADMARAAWADGVITRDERFLLDTLRENLGLSRDEAGALESEAARVRA